MVHPFEAGRSVDGESSKSNLNIQVASGELCLLASWGSERHMSRSYGHIVPLRCR